MGSGLLAVDCFGRCVSARTRWSWSRQKQRPSSSAFGQMDVLQEEMAEAEKGNFEAKLRSMNIIINFAPGFLQIFEKMQETYYVSRDAELFESPVSTAGLTLNPARASISDKPALPAALAVSALPAFFPRIQSCSLMLACCAAGPGCTARGLRPRR